MPRPCGNCGKIGHGKEDCPAILEQFVASGSGKPSTPKKKATKTADRSSKRPRAAAVQVKLKSGSGGLSDARAAIEARRRELVAQVARLDDVLQALDEVSR